MMTCRLLLCAAVMACVGCQQKSSSLRLGPAAFSRRALALNIDLRDFQAMRPSAIQWSFYYSPAVVTQVSVVKGIQLQSFTKHLTCSSTVGRTICLVWSDDAAPIFDGTLARARFTFNGNRLQPETTISLRDIAASSREGTALQLAAASEGSSSRSLRSSPLRSHMLRWAHAHYWAARSAAKRFYQTRVEPLL